MKSMRTSHYGFKSGRKVSVGGAGNLGKMAR